MRELTHEELESVSGGQTNITLTHSGGNERNTNNGDINQSDSEVITVIGNNNNIEVSSTNIVDLS